MTIIKRIIDLFISIFVLIIFFPVIVITAIIIWMTMGRPVLFMQLRPGLKGRLFKIYKFRTMSDERDCFGKLLDGDKRLTPVGRIIRKFSFDELLQLINVLKGDLSLVGPRPLLVDYLSLYSKEQMRRHDVVPGITGWAQVNGRNAISWNKRFELDVWYVDNHSLILDLKILFKTLKKFFNNSDINFVGDTTEEYFTGNIKKKLIIMRGLPGSGKSFLAKQLGFGGVVFSTDDYFMNRSVYKFDCSFLEKAHQWNLERAKWAMRDGLSPVVIDNTNICAWEPLEYVKFGISRQYDVEVRLPETPWANNFSELLKRNTHNLPETVLKRMFDNFNQNITIVDIINSKGPKIPTS